MGIKKANFEADFEFVKKLQKMPALGIFSVTFYISHEILNSIKNLIFYLSLIWYSKKFVICIFANCEAKHSKNFLKKHIKKICL